MRRATFFIQKHKKVSYGIRRFHSVEDFVLWKNGLSNKGKRIVSIEWHDGNPGLDGFKQTSWK